MSSQWTDPRPLSPHLQVWRWHVTMANSILHRATGVAMYLGAGLIAYWLAAIAAGPQAYATAEGLVLSPLGRIVLFGFTLSITFHLANGVRYLFWDNGRGFEPKTADATAVATWVIALAATAAIWFAAYAW